ncbi:MAG: hypothetical protein H6815_00480 [Phycisphaeraceae bacterium]|nr:hypothetical protein [Phycisphaerales bacterium]MCB9858900.1 hypothetical protein [Phycisphaeraceae bacterium]
MVTIQRWARDNKAWLAMMSPAMLFLFVLVAFSGCSSVDDWASQPGISPEQFEKNQQIIDEGEESLSDVIAEVDRLRGELESLDLQGKFGEYRDSVAAMLASATAREQEYRLLILKAEQANAAISEGETRGEQIGHGITFASQFLNAIPGIGNALAWAGSIVGPLIAVRYRGKLKKAINGAAGLVRSVDKAMNETLNTSETLTKFKTTMAMNQGTDASDLYERVRPLAKSACSEMPG